MGVEGTRKTIANCSLKFARPSEMNDPFDGNIYDLYSLDVRDLMDYNGERLIGLLQTDPKAFAGEIGIEIEVATQLSRKMNDVPITEKTKLRSELASTLRERIAQEMSQELTKLEAQRLLEVAKFKNTGIFCATKNNSNLLMWAHYAERHNGVVLGFRPDVEKDSFLRLLVPVVYSDQRPQFYDSMVNWKSEEDEVKQQQIGAKITRLMLYSKSDQWAYEEELRLAIPSEVKEGEAASFLKYYPNELVEIYFGCRMPDEIKSELIYLAKKLNPTIRTFSARLAKRVYDLEFEATT